MNRAFVCLVALGVVAAADQSWSQSSAPLYPAAVYSVPGRPHAVTSGDLNGDGALDLVVGCEDGSITVLLGNPSGAFEVAGTFTGSGIAMDVLLMDLDDDSELDLVTANFSPSSISIFVGNGAGWFEPPFFLPDYNSPMALAKGDMNGDLLEDLVVRHGSSGDFGVFLKDGAGGLGAMIMFPTTGGGASIDVADLNGDGRNDVAVDYSSGVSVSLNSGFGFYPPVSFVIGYYSRAIAIKDLSGDGKLDLVSANTDISVLINTGLGFGAPANYPVLGEVTDVAVGDFDGDGSPDLAAAAPAVQSAVVFLGTGFGAFGPPQVNITSNSPERLEIADFNADSRLDIATANFQDRSVTVLLGDGLGGMVASKLAPMANASISVAPGDLNGDGKLDVVAAGGLSSLSVALGDGTGALGAPGPVDAGQGVSSVVLSDMNLDGGLDVAAASPSWSSVSVLLGTGSGSFLPPSMTTVGANDPEDLAAVDLNGDGYSDVVTADFGSSVASVLLNNGTGGLAFSATWFAGDSYPCDVAVGDVNNDGDVDVAIGHASSSFASVLLGNGQGGFALPVMLPTGGYDIRGLAVGDLDNDGNADVVSANSNSNNITVFAGDGHAGFTADVPMKSFAGPKSVAIADLDGDFWSDVAIANWGAPTVSVYRNDGAGSLQPAQGFVAGIVPWAVVTADMNNDRRVDLVTANSSSSTVGVLLNQSGFAAPVLSAIAPTQSLFNAPTPVTLTGAHFEELAPIGVTFGGQPATAVTWLSSTQISCVTPIGSLGQTVNVTLTQNNVASTLPNAFKYVGTKILGIDASAGNVTGGKLVTATIDHATTLADTVVTLGGVPATVTSVTPQGAVKFIVPAVAEVTGVPRDLVVSSSNGTDTLPAAYLYTPKLSVSMNGSTVTGGSVGLDWITDPAAAAQSLWVWLAVPGGPDLNKSLPAFAGILHADVLFMVLSSFPSQFHPIALSFGPLPPSLVGLTLAMQGVASGEGYGKGTFTNVAQFVMPP